MHVSGFISPDDFWRLNAETEDKIRAQVNELPLYEITDWTGDRLIGEWGFENGVLRKACLLHGDDPVDGTDPGANVHTTVSSSTDHVVHLKCQLLGQPRDGEQFYRTLVALNKQPTEPVRIKVNGEFIEFQLSQWNARWWAAATINGFGLVVEARDIALGDVALKQISDVEPYLIGRRNWMKRLRQEADG